MTKVDVVVSFYQQEKYLPHLIRSLENNADHINRVIFVNDEVTPQPFINTPLDYVWLDHPHFGFGLSRSANQGIAAADTEYVLLIEGDELLAPGSIADMFEALDQAGEPVALLAGRKRYLDIDALMNDSQFKFIEEDHRLNLMANPLWEASRPWVFFSGGHLLVKKSCHLAINGFNEEFGYGYHDFDYAARMMLAFGRSSCRYGAGEVWHIGTGKGRSLPGSREAELFAVTLGNFFNHNYSLDWPREDKAWLLNLGTLDADAHPLNLKRLSFMPPGKVNSIEVHSRWFESSLVEAAELLFSKLRPGGVLRVCAPNYDIETAVKLVGFQIDSITPVLEATKPEGEE